MQPIQDAWHNFKLPAIDPEVKDFFKKHSKLILGILLAGGLLYSTGLARPVSMLLLGPMTYGTLKVSIYVVSYLLSKSVSAALSFTLGQFSYLELLTLGVCAVGFASQTIGEKASRVLGTQRDGAEN